MPPRGGQPRDTTRRPQSTSFNTCPHAGGNDLQRQRRPDRGVSIHAPTRGATSRPVSYHTRGGFNTCPHAGGNCRSARPCTPSRWFQYMPPRGGQLEASARGGTRYIVSIHAPTRGATGRQVHAGLSRLVSIHAPTRGATGASLLWGHNTDVSIHAPTRGATNKI